LHERKDAFRLYGALTPGWKEMLERWRNLPIGGTQELVWPKTT
jgi:hypothetical protein